MDVDFNSLPSEVTAEFWKDIPDDVLEEVYRQLEPDGMGGSMIDGDEFQFEQSGALDQGYQAYTSSSSFNRTPTMDDEDDLASDVNDHLHQQHPHMHHHHHQQMLHMHHHSPNVRSYMFTGGAQTRIEVQQSKEFLQQIMQSETTLQQQIEKLRQVQHQLAINPMKDAINAQKSQLDNLTQQIEHLLQQIRAINTTVILETSELNTSRTVIQSLIIQRQIIDVYKKELNYIATNAGPQVFGAVLIVDQPIPQVLFKSKAMEDNFTIKLFTSTTIEPQSCGKVHASLVAEDKTWKADRPLENDESQLDMFTRKAIFNHVKINISTRMAMVHLKFGLTLATTSGASSNIESTPSLPIIVITNESQWCEAEGKLLILDAFSGEAEIPWPQLANAIHHHFLKATRQDLCRPSRAISFAEFDFIHKKFFGALDYVSSPLASKFWFWFGQVTQTLRFKRHVNAMWYTGLIFGLITKEECNRALLGQDLGTFMIRFSENHPGLFAVAYVDDDPEEPVKHYLIRSDDIGSQKTLPDFLREKSQFRFLFQLDPLTGILSPFAKDAVLGSFYSKTKRSGDANPTGYVTL
eukprot:TRINITY_DN327_c1_g1_i1.p1 TRINITY_DN327_c1_g1~~TRINITY_DN327_c1_g1_i1.p1  ORF type:complete len:579 (-),score=248.03 TRINITY_DN327_c1_g1_i1:403-2139(-)